MLLKMDVEIMENHGKSWKIMENHRIYHISNVATEQQVVNQIINNYNTMNNFVSGIEPIKKLNEFLKHNNAATLPFEMSVERKYERERLLLEEGNGYHPMDLDFLFEVIDNVTGVESKNMEDFNFYYDHAVKRVKLFEEGEWKEFYISSGLKKIINIIQDFFWHTYESYLIRKLHKTTNAFDKQKFRELLIEYYRFLACVDVSPYVKDTPNNKILYTNDDDEYWHDPRPGAPEAWSLSDEYHGLYNRTHEELTVRQREKLKHDLHELLRRNSKRNTMELNKVIMSLVNIDTDFKREVLHLADVI
jgi:hypothetical protein